MGQTELVTIPAQTALQVFTTDGAMEPFLARVAEIYGLPKSVDIATAAKAKAQNRTSLGFKAESTMR